MTARMIRTALSLALIAILATSAAFARHGGQGRGNPIDRMAQELSLTAEQKTKLEALFQAQREKMKARHEAMETKLRTILTPEQQKQLDEMKAQRKAHRNQAGPKAPPTARDGKAGPGGKQRGPLAQLNLTEEQKAQLKAWFQEERPQMQADRKAFRSEVEAILTPEQRAKLQQKMEERRNNRPRGKQGQPQQPGPGPQQAPPQQPSNDGDSNF